MLKILGLVGPVLRLVSGTIKPATDMIAKVPKFVDDLAGRADKSPGKSSAGILGVIVGWLGWDLGFLPDIGVMIANIGQWVVMNSG